VIPFGFGSDVFNQNQFLYFVGKLSLLYPEQWKTGLWVCLESVCTSLNTATC